MFRKSALIIFLIFSRALSAGAQENFSLDFTFDTVGFGYLFNEGPNILFTATLLNMSVEYEPTHLGLQCDAGALWIAFFHDPDYNIDDFYFFNPTFYWNALGFTESFFLGPYFSVNYLNLEYLLTFDTKRIHFYFNKVLLSAGIRFKWNTGLKNSFLPLWLVAEAGYRTKISEGNFYIDIGFSFPL